MKEKKQAALYELENQLSQINKDEALFVLNLSTTEFNKNPTAIAESDSIIAKERVYINAEGNLEIIYCSNDKSSTGIDNFKLIISGNFMYNSITSVEMQYTGMGKTDETEDTYKFTRRIASYNFATNTPVYTNDEHDGIASIENLDEYKEFVAFYGDIDEDDVQFVYDSEKKVYNRK